MFIGSVRRPGLIIWPDETLRTVRRVKEHHQGIGTHGNTAKHLYGLENFHGAFLLLQVNGACRT